MTGWDSVSTFFGVLDVRLIASRDERLNLTVVIANCDYGREHYGR